MHRQCGGTPSYKQGNVQLPVLLQATCFFYLFYIMLFARTTNKQIRVSHLPEFTKTGWKRGKEQNHKKLKLLIKNKAHIKKLESASLIISLQSGGDCRDGNGRE